MEESVQHPSAGNEVKLSLFGKALQIVAYPVSAGIGYFVGHIKLHREAYDTLKRFGAFKDILQEGKEGSLHRRNIDNVRARGKGSYDLDTFLKKSAETRTEYSELVGKEMEKFMGEAKGLKLFAREWSYVNRSSKLEAAMTGVTASTIALGALMYLTSTKSFNDYFRDTSQDSPKR